MTVGSGRIAGGPRRRFRFSLNGLAIQLSGLALSFTLVALLVVTGSQAAFVEPSEAVENYVPVGAPAPTGTTPRPRPAAASPAPEPAPVDTPLLPPSETPVEPEEPPSEEVELTDSDAGTAMFGDDAPLAPGTSLVRCLDVSYSGDADTASPVLLYASAVSGDLAPYLDLVVDLGRAGDEVSGDCAGFTSADTLFSGTLAAFAARHGDYRSGLPAWVPTRENETRSFRFGVALRDEPAAAGRSVGFGFSWETRAD